MTKIQNEPRLLGSNLINGELLHFAHVLRFRQYVVLQLYVEGALRLAIGHEESEVQILLGTPSHPLHRISQSRTKFIHIGIVGGGWRHHLYQTGIHLSWKPETKTETRSSCNKYSMKRASGDSEAARELVENQFACGRVNPATGRVKG